MLRRTPIAVIQRQGPSIRHDARFETGVRKRYHPKRTSSSLSRSTQALSPRTPNKIRTGRERAPTRIGKRIDAMRASVGNDAIAWIERPCQYPLVVLTEE